MKVLMFGWEFPPFISGGLGTACYGVTKGLINNGVEVTFVIPTRRGRENADVRVLGADEVPLLRIEEIPFIRDSKLMKKRAKIIGISSKGPVSPYYTSKGSMRYMKFDASYAAKTRRVATRINAERGSILEFAGNYGGRLFEEVENYGAVAESLAFLENFDIIHAHDWITFPAGVRAKLISGKPLVVHIHATEFDRSGENMNPHVYNIEKYGMQNADKIIAVSYYTKNIITKRYGINPKKIEVIHNAINREKQIQRYNIKKKNGEKTVLSLGRVTMQKGPDYFLEAANLVLKKIKNVRFVMAGSGDMLPKMISRMAELKIADKFHFTGFLKGMEVEKIYAMSDLYVMPSVSEPFGLTAFEALLYDIPIIISKQSGVSEVLRNAVMVDFWDVKKLAGTMIALLENDKLARRVVEKCQEEIKNISWNNAGYKIKKLYEALV
jgi:glycosyltransferase involved in cell wall biosynthesis